MSPNRNPKIMRKFDSGYYFVLIPTSALVSQVTVEDRYTRMRETQKKRERRKEERQRTRFTNDFFCSVYFANAEMFGSWSVSFANAIVERCVCVCVSVLCMRMQACTSCPIYMDLNYVQRNR